MPVDFPGATQDEVSGHGDPAESQGAILDLFEARKGQAKPKSEPSTAAPAKPMAKENQKEDGMYDNKHSRKKIEIDDATLVGLVDKGLSKSEIAAKLGCSPGPVTRKLKEMGLDAQRGKRGGSTPWRPKGWVAAPKPEKPTPKKIGRPRRSPEEAESPEPAITLSPVGAVSVEKMPEAIEPLRPGVAVPPALPETSRNGHAELRVVMFEFKGSAASADKAFAAIQAALAR